MAQKGKLPMLFKHVVARLQDSIVVFGGSQAVYSKEFNLDFEPQSLRVIWVYGLYTDRWTNYVIPESEKAPPIGGIHCGRLGMTVKTDIYMFAVPKNNAGTIWKLTRDRQCSFSWCEVPVKKPPLYRYDMTGWQHAGKLWIFGGYGPLPTAPYLEQNEGYNNQLLCFDPLCRVWTKWLKCHGTLPAPRAECCSAMIGNETWLYGGKSDDLIFHDLFKLNMNNLTWTQVQCKQPIPKLVDACLIPVLSDSKIVLYGLTELIVQKNFAWILDVASLSWNVCACLNHLTYDQNAISGQNSILIIGGYEHRQGTYKSTLCIRLGPKTLQHLARKAIHRHKDTLPWKLLPNKLKCDIGTE